MKRFHMRRDNFIDMRTIGYASARYENCDALIDQIQDFYNKNETVISLEDKQRLLLMLTRIEKSQKCLPNAEKQNMYGLFGLMRTKYNAR